MDKKGKINSEKEYWEEHKKWKDQVKTILKENYKDPSEVLKKFTKMLDHSQKIGLFSDEFINKIRKEMNREPPNLSLTEQKLWLKRKFNKLFGKS